MKQAASPHTMNSTAAPASTLFLGQSGEAWDLWVILSLVLAVIAACAVAAATMGSVTSHKREARAAEQALEAFKFATDTKVAEANAGLGKAQLEIAKANEGAAKANEAAATANRDAAQLKVALANTEAEISRAKIPLIERSLSPKQAKLIEDQLRGSGLLVSVFVEGDGREPNAFFDQIYGAFSNAGVAGGVVRGGSVRMNGVTAFPLGLNVSGPPTEKARLLAVLRAAGLTVGEQEMSGSQAFTFFGGGLQLTIGPRENLSH